MEEVPFDVAAWLSAEVQRAADAESEFGPGFDPEVRLSGNPRFGDYQANGVLAFARQQKVNPRELGTRLQETIEAASAGSGHFEVSVAGPGFINFKLSNAVLSGWIRRHATRAQLAEGSSAIFSGRRVVIDYPSANVAKRAHIGHLRPMVIGESIARLLKFCGADLVRDNHIGDWGTNFGTLIMVLKRKGIDIGSLGEDPLGALDGLYKEGTRLEAEEPGLREQSRRELVLLQTGDPENIRLWKRIVAVSLEAFGELFHRLGVGTDLTLGESFYRDRVERVYRELEETGLAEESDGALVVWHDEVARFSRHSERAFPFNVRKRDGASNYASTDLATVLYRVEDLGAQEIVYLTDSRQQDHFQQLFLTVEKWFKAKGYRLPRMHHVWWGTILGEDKKPIKTRSGESIELKAFLDEAVERAMAVVSAKNPELEVGERTAIAEAVGIGAVKYADLSSNRTQDYVFGWERLLSFEGNTAPYLQYAVARIRSIFRNLELLPDAFDGDGASDIETEAERLLAVKLLAFPIALRTSLSELRPHHICTYLYELAGDFSSFYASEKVAVADLPVRQRRLMLCSRTLLVLETGLDLLGISAPERM